MEVSFTISWTSTARKIFSGLREKRFDHDDSTSLCHSKTLTAMKRWIPFLCRSSARVSTVNFAARRFLMAAWVEGKFFPPFFISWRVHGSYSVRQVYELITCVRRANENARNLMSIVQFLIINNYSMRARWIWDCK